MDAYSQVRGKCAWWRETPDEDDASSTRIKAEDKRVRCVCFVEGKGWEFKTREVPSDCPDRLHCRYYIKNM